MKKMIAIALVLMLCVSALSISAFAADKFTVTVEIDSATAPNAWAWGDYGNAFSTWPGVPMTKDGNVWKIDVPMGTTGFIVNNGTAKTADIAIPGTGDVTIKVSADFSSYEVVGYVAPAPSGYYVTGSSDVFSNWAERNENGKMTESNGIYVKEFTGVPAGDYKLKVNIGNWTQSWGKDGQDYEFSVAEANSTVKVTFNPADGSVVVDVNGAQQGGGEDTPPPATFDAYFVAGTGALCNGIEWNPSAPENAMTKGEDGIWTITFTNVPAGEHKLKVTAGNWDNCWGAVSNGDADGNIVFTLEEAAEKIVVKFNPTTSRVSVYNGDNAITGDMSLAGVGIALLAATAGVVALVGKKKEF